MEINHTTVHMLAYAIFVCLIVYVRMTAVDLLLPRYITDTVASGVEPTLCSIDLRHTDGSKTSFTFVGPPTMCYDRSAIDQIIDSTKFYARKIGGFPSESVLEGRRIIVVEKYPLSSITVQRIDRILVRTAMVVRIGYVVDDAYDMYAEARERATYVINARPLVQFQKGYLHNTVLFCADNYGAFTDTDMAQNPVIQVGIINVRNGHITIMPVRCMLLPRPQNDGNHQS